MPIVAVSASFKPTRWCRQSFTGSRCQPCRVHAGSSTRAVRVRAQTGSGNGGNKAEEFQSEVEKMSKMSKVSLGQYFFYRIKAKAEEKFQTILEKTRQNWQREEDQQLRKVAPRIGNEELALGGGVLALKNAIWMGLLQLFYLPATLLLQTAIKVTTWWQSKFGATQFEYFLMAEGEKIWGWRNRMENERWFWSYFMFRVLLPTVLGIFVYEAFVPNNVLWAVALPYWFYWQFQKVLLTPWVFDWWLIMYFGFYLKCWPEFVQWARFLFMW